MSRRCPKRVGTHITGASPPSQPVARSVWLVNKKGRDKSRPQKFAPLTYMNALTRRATGESP